MASVVEIADWLVGSFDPTQSSTIDKAINSALREKGFGRFAASEEASSKSRKVLAELQSRLPEDLPFDFSDQDATRLVGKQRIRARDSTEAKAVRKRLSLSSSMHDALYNCSPAEFEMICAGAMHLSGAREAYAIAAGDDGGIDIYGRIGLGCKESTLHHGLIETSLFSKEILFLGQCKRESLDTKHGRPILQQFHGAVTHCLTKYKTGDKGPRKRVPASYYRENELCIRLFFTTADFTDTAPDAANDLDIILIKGAKIARFLVFHRVGLIAGANGEYEVEKKQLLTWANSFGKVASESLSP